MVAVLKRVWAFPVWAHALGLCVVLLVLFPFAKSGAVFFPDEGSGLAQAQQLADGVGWSRDPSFPAVDPQLETFPILNSPTADRIVPLGQHPAYALVVVPAYAALGANGAALLSIGGLVATAVLGARLARRLRPGLERAALWAIALGSPLFVDGFLVVGHTLAALCVAGMALATVRVVERERVPLMIVIAGVLGVTAGLLRNEAVVLALALGVVCAGVALVNRSAPLAVTGGVVIGAAAIARRVDSALRTHVAPGNGAAAFSVPGAQRGFVAERVLGAVITLLLPSTGNFGIGDILLVLAVLCAVGAAVIARRRPEDRSGLLLFGGLAVGLAALRLVFPSSPVPAILWACPLLTVALVLGDRALLSTTPRRILSLTTVLFTAGVLVTQYGNGGGIQWGFRYFAVALPFVIPLALIAIVDGASRLSEEDRRVVLPMFVGLCALVTILGFVSLRSTRSENATIADGTRAAYLATPAADGGKPVVVSTEIGRIDRYDWKHVDEARWLILDEDHRARLGEYLDRLASLGVGQVTLVTDDVVRDRPLLQGHAEVTEDRPLPAGHDAVTLQLA